MSFHTMDPAMHRRISSLGGKAAHAKGVAAHFTAETAKTNGAKGGQTTVARHSAEHMRKIGARGGAVRKAKMVAKRAADERQRADDANAALERLLNSPLAGG